MNKPWLNAYPPGTPAEIDPDACSSVVKLFEESCHRYAERPAFHNLGVTLTYAELGQLSRSFAAYLLTAGLARGDRVALMMPNLLQYPVALFGALRAGMTVVNINPLLTPRELRHQLIDSGARCIVVLENFAHVLAQVRSDTSVEHIVTTAVADLAHLPKRTTVNFFVRRVRHLVPPYDLPGAVRFRRALAIGERAQGCSMPEVGSRDIALLQYTGGTTGIPKGAMLTHRNLVANVLQLEAFWKNLLEPGREIVITPLPLYHIFSLTCNCLLFTHLGGLNVLITDPRDTPALINELRKWRFTLMTGVNTLYNALLQHPRLRAVKFPGMKLAVAGGMALHPKVADEWQKITGRPLIEGYGLTETSPVVACGSYLLPRSGTVGIPLPSTQISIRDGDAEVAPGQPGELWVRGPQVMPGYWKRPDETAKTLTPNGWLATGDIAVLEPDGFLKIVDRKKDLIIVSGFKVFPNEIEAVIDEHPAVLESGCIGVPDMHSGQAVKLFVVVREGYSLGSAELHEYCEQHFTAYKRPTHVEFRQSLPKTNVGKILRRQLALEETNQAALQPQINAAGATSR